MKIALMTIGTRGDVQPFAALALGLSARGHDVLLAAPPNSRGFVEGRGIAYRELGIDLGEALTRPDLAALAGKASMLDFARLRRSIMRDMNAKIAVEAPRIFTWADLVVFKTPLAPACAAARRRGLPCLEASLIPLLPTRTSAGILFGGRDLGAPANLALTWAMNALVLRSATRPRGAPLLMAMSPSVYPRPADWGDDVVMAGYWFLDRPPDWSPPPEVEAFLAPDSPEDAPIYFGFGSMPDGDPAAVARAIRKACGRLGRRGIVNRGWAGLEEVERGGADRKCLLFVDGLPHDWLFPRVAAAVHHGGAGTTAAALRASIPSVIVPHMGDQPMWGRLLQRLGAAPAPIRADRLDATKLEGALREALDGGRMAARARDVSSAIAGEDGVTAAVAAIEAYARSC